MFTLYGTDPATATAAVLGYRVFQLGLPVVLGSLALVRITKVVADGPRQDGPLTRASRNDSIASTSAVGDADA
jgi:hypothetical protein